MNDPDWARVLSYLYEYEESISEKNTGDIDNISIPESGDIVSHIDIGHSDIEDTVSYMESVGLVTRKFENIEAISETDKEIERSFILTEKGFEVAHERELAEEQNQVSKRSANLSGYLVVGIIIQALFSLSSIEGTLNSILYGFLIIGLLSLVMVELDLELFDKLRGAITR